MAKQTRASTRARMAASRTQADAPALVANPDRIRLDVAPVVRPETTVILYGVFNDAQRLDELAEGGEMNPWIAEKLKEPIFQTETAGEAKREQNRINRYRFENPAEMIIGPAMLREQTVTRTEWTTITGADWDEIDDGTRPNG